MVPWLNPVELVTAGVFALAELEEPPGDPGSSPLDPAPETPGTDSGAEVALEPEALLEPVPGLSPVPVKSLSMTRVFVISTVLFVAEGSV
jgi:hypothetical protein